MANVVDYQTIINSIEFNLFELSEEQKVKILAIILYPHESYSSLTQTQLDKVRNILINFK